MSNYAKLSGLSKDTSKVAQTSPLNDTQVKNNAGGYSFVTTEIEQLKRFLTIGSASGTYYVGKEDLTKQNVSLLEELLATDGMAVLNTIYDISFNGKAIKNETCVFALAVAVYKAKGNPELKKAALDILPKVCRTSTDLFAFIETYKKIGGGFGSSVRKALSDWYLKKDLEALSYQLVKYRQRNGWTHFDVLSLAHPKADSEQRNVLFKFAKSGTDLDVPSNVLLPKHVEGFLKAQKASTAKEICNLITDFSLPREAIPTQFLNDKSVWEALLPQMNGTALIRNLGVMTSKGLFGNLSAAHNLVCKRLSDQVFIKKNRLHPIFILNAVKTYGMGRGDKGSTVWSPDSRISNNLNDAFYLSFDNIEPNDKRYLIGVDVSGSMTYGNVAGFNLTPAECAAALSMVINKANQNSLVMGFSHKFIDLNISYKDRLQTVLKKVQHSSFGGTDCALPMTYAKSQGINVDVFAVITDNETYYGQVHPSVALKEYRQRTGIKSSLGVIATAATRFTIADPNDPKQIDISGFSPDIVRVLDSL